MTDSGLDPSHYILQCFETIVLEGLRLNADLMTFDKKRLIQDLLQGAEVDYSTPDFLDNQIKLERIGYAWCSPLSDREYHLGCGSLLADPRLVLKGLNWIDTRDHHKILCACEGPNRGTNHSDFLSTGRFSIGASPFGNVRIVGSPHGCPPGRVRLSGPRLNN